MDIGNMPMYPIFNALMFIGVILIGWIILRLYRKYCYGGVIYTVFRIIGRMKAQAHAGYNDGQLP